MNCDDFVLFLSPYPRCASYDSELLQFVLYSKFPFLMNYYYFDVRILNLFLYVT